MSSAMATSSSSKYSPPKRTSLSKHPVLPPIKVEGQDLPQVHKSMTPKKKKTPFSLPSGEEVFAVREKVRVKEREDWAHERTLNVHEKGTYSTRMKNMLANLRRQVKAMDATVKAEETLGQEKKPAALQEDTEFVLTTTRDRQIEKEDLSNYIGRKREMFLVQYSLGVKKDEISKLIAIREAEEKKLEAAEQYIELSATVFDEFLKENDKAAVEAIKKAELATKAKLEKVAEIKRLNAQMVAIKNEMSRNNDLILELNTYKNFLDNLTTDEVREQWRVTNNRDSTSSEKATEESNEGGASKKEEAELYFTRPSQLMSVFTELEEQNLSLIQNSQETQVALEELRQNRQAVERTMNKEVESLRKQIELMKLNIAYEDEKATDLEIKSKMYSYGEYRADDQDFMMVQLDKKVADVYNKCIGSNEANIPTLQMLAAIESRMEELFEMMESMPPDKIEAAEKAKEKERRLRMREEKLEEQRTAQEERLKRALERAQADPKKRLGRKLVYRSDPPVLKRRQAEKDEKKEKEEEELLYFFS